MLPNSMEGRWEEIRNEILAYDKELVGERVQFKILPKKKPVTLDIALAPILEKAKYLKPIKPKPLSPLKQAYGDAVTQKFKKQGFSL